MADDVVTLRTDARVNRDRILDVARAALAADPDTSLNAIAKAAGVGAGTLYRHFPSRESLLVGVFRMEIDALVALAPTLLDERPPLRAFRLWCRRFAAFGSVKHGAADTLHAAISDEEFQGTYRQLADAVGQMISACEAAGGVNCGIEPEDVLVLLSSTLRIPPTPHGQAQVRRVLTMIFRSLGAHDGAEEDADCC